MNSVCICWIDFLKIIQLFFNISIIIDALLLCLFSFLQVSYVVPVPVAVGSLWTFCPAVTLVKLALSYSSSGVSWLFIYTVATAAFMHVPSLISCDM